MRREDLDGGFGDDFQEKDVQDKEKQEAELFQEFHDDTHDLDLIEQSGKNNACLVHKEEEEEEDKDVGGLIDVVLCHGVCPFQNARKVSGNCLH